MNRSTYILFSCFIFILCAGFLSCNDDISYSGNSAHRLSFSQDTIHFDTVFTTIGTSTRILKVYNKNNEHLEFTSIELAGKESSFFRINVDGHSGTHFTGMDIRKQDSMYVFVDVNVDPTQSGNPILVKDSLVFRMSNGLQQNVKLIAYGKDVYILRGKVIEQDTVFTAEKPIVVYDSLRVNEGNFLAFTEGTELYFHDKIYLNVYGTLIAQGSLEKPVVFRGDRMDWMFSDTPYDKLPGQWGGIRFYESSYNNYLEYVDIHSSEYGVICDSSDVSRSTLDIYNSLIHTVSYDGINIVASKAFIVNTEITNARRYCVSLLGGNVDFVHCTIASFPFRRNRRKTDSYAVSVFAEMDKPLIRGVFTNCVITGSKTDELIGSNEEKDDEAAEFNYAFFNSLVNTVIDDKDKEKYEATLSHYIDVVWDNKGGKNFLYIDSESFYTDFRLDSLSDARGIAHEEVALAYPFDRYGRLRLTDNGPDAGCYQWVPEDQPEE